MAVAGREPTDWERALLALFAQADVPARAALSQQIAGVRILSEEPGYIDLEPLVSAPKLDSFVGFPLEARYLEEDGWPVVYLLHAVYATARISTLEYYRGDGDAIILREPPVAEIEIVPFGQSGSPNFESEMLRRLRAL